MGHALISGPLCGSKSLAIDKGTQGQFRNFSPGPVCAEQLGTAKFSDAISREHNGPESELNIDKNGIAHNANILQSTPTGSASVSKNLERKPMPKVNGVIVHQTGGSKASSTFNNYAQTGAKGAHFLIDKDGCIYQTAALNMTTVHVGPLRSRCEAESSCSAEENKLNKKWDVKAMDRREQSKEAGTRYPANKDAIGIELVGAASKVAGQTDEVYDKVTDAQNESLAWLVQQLQLEFEFPNTEVFRHPDVSRKTPSEASTAKW